MMAKTAFGKDLVMGFTCFLTSETFLEGLKVNNHSPKRREEWLKEMMKMVFIEEENNEDNNLSAIEDDNWIKKTLNYYNKQSTSSSTLVLPFLCTLPIQSQLCIINYLINEYKYFKRKDLIELLELLITTKENTQSSHLRVLCLELSKKLNERALIEKFSNIKDNNNIFLTTNVQENNAFHSTSKVLEMYEVPIFIRKEKRTLEESNIVQVEEEETTIINIEEDEIEEEDIIDKKIETKELLISEQPIIKKPKIMELSSELKKELQKVKKLIEKATNPKGLKIDFTLFSNCSTDELELLLKELGIDKLHENITSYFVQSCVEIMKEESISIIVQYFILSKAKGLKQKASRQLFQMIQVISSSFMNSIVNDLMIPLLNSQPLNVDQLELLSRIVEKILKIEQKTELLQYILKSTQEIIWNDDLFTFIQKLLMSGTNITTVESLVVKLDELAPNFTKSLKFAVLLNQILTLFGNKLVSHISLLKEIVTVNETNMKEGLSKKIQQIK
ncbi:hypothetical protein ABK040_002943 [Willaertia magna]